jgi:hypothetical protein
MRHSNLAGMALRLLCLPLAVVALTSCERHHPRQQQVQTFENHDPDAEMRETRQLIEETKRHPSLQPGSNEAGPPIHVDPYPHSAGMKHDEHSGDHTTKK